MNDSPKKGLLSGLKNIIARKEAPEYIEPELPPLPEDLPMAADKPELPVEARLPEIPMTEETLPEEPLAPSLPEEPAETLESITGKVIQELPELPESDSRQEIPSFTAGRALREVPKEELPPIPEWHEPKVTIPTPEDEEVPERIKEVLNKLTINEEMIMKGRQELDKQISEVDEKIKKIDAELAELMRI